MTALFFADDLLLFSRTPKMGMHRLLRTSAGFCKDLHMKLSAAKTYILSNAWRFLGR